jgi:hypothetical protein
MYTYICRCVYNPPYLARFFSDDQMTKMTISPLSATSFSPHVYIQYASVNATPQHMTKKTKAECILSLCKHS